MVQPTPHSTLMELALSGAGRHDAPGCAELERLLGALAVADFEWKGRASCGRPWLVLALAGWPEASSPRHRTLSDQASFALWGRRGRPGIHEPWERLAGLLLSQGADPFDGALDTCGNLLPYDGSAGPSGFHAAWHVQAHAVLATMLLHPNSPPPQAWERSLAPTGEPWLEAAAAQGLIPWLEALIAHGVRPGHRALGVLGKQEPDVTLKALKVLWGAGARAYVCDESSRGLSAKWLLSFTHDPSDAFAWLENQGVDTQPDLMDWRFIAPRGQHYLWSRWTHHWTSQQWLATVDVSDDCRLPLAWWLVLNALPGMVFSPDGPATSVRNEWWSSLVSSLDVWPDDLQSFVSNWPGENSTRPRDHRLTVPGWLVLRTVMKEARLPADVVLRVDETMEQALLELTHLVRMSDTVPPDAIAWWSAFLSMKNKSCIHRGLAILAEALAELPACAHDGLLVNQDVKVVVGVLTVVSSVPGSLQRFPPNSPWLSALFSSPAMLASSELWPGLLANLSGLRPDLAARAHAARLVGAWGETDQAAAPRRF